MNTPLGLTILRNSNRVRLIAIGILIINAVTVLIINPDDGFFLRLAGIIIKPLHLDYPFIIISKTIFTMIGYYWIPILLIYLENVFIKNKAKIGFYIIVVIDVSLTASFRLSILSFLIILMIIPTSSRLYFMKGKMTEEPQKNSIQDNV